MWNGRIGPLLGTSKRDRKGEQMQLGLLHKIKESNILILNHSFRVSLIIIE